jgi:hypothetical protein
VSQLLLAAILAVAVVLGALGILAWLIFKDGPDTAERDPFGDDACELTTRDDPSWLALDAELDAAFKPLAPYYPALESAR